MQLMPETQSEKVTIRPVEGNPLERRIFVGERMVADVNLRQDAMVRTTWRDEEGRSTTQGLSTDAIKANLRMQAMANDLITATQRYIERTPKA